MSRKKTEFDITGLCSHVTPVLYYVHSWFSTDQVVDLKAEGLWEELLDEFQPEIVIQDWLVMKHPIFAV